MTCTDLPLPAPTAARSDDSTLFAALELSRKSWLVATNAPGEEKISKRTIAAGDGRLLLDLLAGLRQKAERRIGKPVRVVVIQEAGLDGFWLHRLLEANGLESHVVDPASIAVDRRKRRRKTDALDADALLRTVMAWARGERRVCSMVRPPSPEEEDRRRLSREREALVKERIQHTNRIKGLLAAQGIANFEPLRSDHRAGLDGLTTGDGRPLPPRLTAEIRRQLARLEAVIADLKAVEAQRDALLAGNEPSTSAAPTEAAGTAPAEATVLSKLKGIGPEFASVLCLELLFRSFSNRREVASYAGLTPSPFKSGGIDREQGISKSGNPRLRKMMLQLAWMWIRYQPGSAISRWFAEFAGTKRGRIRRIGIVAVARKLLVALWRFATQGVVPEGAALKS
jgi:transposase